MKADLSSAEGFTAAVLAGGKGKRLGLDKTGLVIKGEPVLRRIVFLMMEIFPRVLVVAQEGNHSLEEVDDGKVRVVCDIIPDKGPMGGIYTALARSEDPYVFVTACDMPYPRPELIRRLLTEAPGWEAVVPRRGRYIEPLFSVYARNVRERMREKLEGGRLKIYEFIGELRVRYLEEEEIARYDPEFLSFFNVNTPEDLEKAHRYSLHDGF